MDFETYSEAGHVWDEATCKWRALPNASQGKKGLPVVGAAVYTEHPTAEVLCLAYDLKGGEGPHLWHPGLPPPVDLWVHVLSAAPPEAWNVSFERWVWENICVRKYGWPPLQPGALRCAMGKARSYCLPGALAMAGKALGADTLKDPEGVRLLDKFSVPRNPTKTDARKRIMPLWAPEDVQRELARYAVDPALPAAKQAKMREAWLRVLEGDHADTVALGRYCLADIAAEADISARVPELSPVELAYWQDDQEINHRGVAVDVDALHACISIIEQATERYHAELQALTGIDAATKVAQILGWLHGRGVHLDSLDEEAVEAALRWDLPADARRVLEIRAAVGSASVKKVYSLRNMLAADGRVHDLYMWSGARTGRPTGSGPQPTNLPKAGPPTVKCAACGQHHAPAAATCPKCGMPCPPGRKPLEWSPAAMEDALTAIRTRSLDYVEHIFGVGQAVAAVAGVLRGLFVPKPGHDFISSDFTAIEGVVIACIAGEQWRIEAFAQDRSLYIESASRAFKIPIAEFERHKEETGQHHPMRQIGKGMELGLGFGGWINALRQFDVEGDDEELKGYVLAWREASPAIEYFWGGQKIRWKPAMFGLEGMAVSAVMNPGREYPVMRLDGTPTGISYVMVGDVLHCKLLSGRSIAYHCPRLAQSVDAWRGLSLSFEGHNTNPKNGPIGWIRMNTYGGRLAENVVQATARDIQMNAIRNLEAARQPVALHTYDEVVCEVPEGTGSVEELEALMCAEPPWAATWPIKAAGGWRAKRYRKG